MEITYIFHSGVCVELERTVLLFDYWKGETPRFPKEKTIYVFASHRHPDHFAADIFRLSEQYADIRYIMSNDIKVSTDIPISVLSQITFVKKHEVCHIDNITVQTLASTDEGVAFLVRAEEKQIYHAGDLNWWHWNGESKAYNRNMEVNYKREIDMLKDCRPDLAFLPLDPRLEDAYDKGINYFMEHVDCAHIMPIHFWETYSLIQTFKKSLPQPLRDKIMEILCEGERFVV